MKKRNLLLISLLSSVFVNNSSHASSRLFRLAKEEGHSILRRATSLVSPRVFHTQNQERFVTQPYTSVFREKQIRRKQIPYERYESHQSSNFSSYLSLLGMGGVVTLSTIDQSFCDEDKDPVNNEMDRVELFAALERVVNVTIKDIEKFDNIPDTRVMVLGTTGAGKSTLVHQLVGKLVYAELVKTQITSPVDKKVLSIDKKVLSVDKKDQIPGFEIGIGTSSCTTTPNSYHDETNKLIWWDCPGFLDTKGVIQELSNQLSVSKLFTGKENMSILLVVPQTFLELSNKRGQDAWSALECIVNMFKKQEGSSQDEQQTLADIKKGIVLVVTHANSEFNMDNSLTILNSGAHPAGTSKMAEGLMDYLTLNVDTKCFVSYAPCKEQIGQEIILSGRNKILETFTHSKSKLFAEKAIVSTKANQCAEAVTDIIRNNIGLLLATYVGNIMSGLNIDTPIADLEKFEKFFIQFKTIDGDSNFIQQLESVNENDSKMLSEKIKTIGDVHKYLKIFGVTPIGIGQIWRKESGNAMINLKTLINASKKMQDATLEEQKKMKEELSKKDIEMQETLKKRMGEEKEKRENIQREFERKAREDAANSKFWTSIAKGVADGAVTAAIRFFGGW